MISLEFAEALYSLAKDENCTYEIYNQLSAVKFAFSDNPNLGKILDRPCSDTKENDALIDRCFSDINNHLLNCIKVMSKRRISSRFSETADEFMRLYRRENGIENVNVITAVELDKDMKKMLEAKLEKKLEKKLSVSYSVDSSILGGVVVQTETAQIDSSVRARLKSVEKQIKTATV